MTLSTVSRRWLESGLGNAAAAREIEGLLAGALGARIFFVSSVSGSNSGAFDGLSWQTPFATLAFALTQVTASQGDTIVLMPGHAESTTAIAWNKAGIRVIGVGLGRNRPTLTATTGASDLINVTAANGELRNVRLVGAASGVTALLDIAAADFACYGVSFEPLATPLMSVTLAAGGVRPVFEDCTWLVTVNGPDCAIDIETSTNDYGVVKRCTFNAAGIGWDLGVIRAAADAAIGWEIQDCTFISCDTVAIDFNSSAGAAGVDGVVEDCTFVATAALASVEDIIDTGRYIFKECYAHDITNFTTAAARVPIGTVA